MHSRTLGLTNSLFAVKAINEGPPAVHPHRGLLEFSRMLLARTGATISLTSRMASQSTDNLARLGTEQGEDPVVTAQVPPSTREFCHCPQLASSTRFRTSLVVIRRVPIC